MAEQEEPQIEIRLEELLSAMRRARKHMQFCLRDISDCARCRAAVQVNLFAAVRSCPSARLL